ncbi:Hypp7783 [Branchiostoma lanceolatum]|uniref:Hypp7783 protein n=1 Tax=Branchiostoma lanceolatum TaxID=7740 RepID=A0A8J9Z463_BRALA|nr:Hypp7783 [Branchiostoma lanceolatum]
MEGKNPKPGKKVLLKSHSMPESKFAAKIAEMRSEDAEGGSDAGGDGVATGDEPSTAEDNTSEDVDKFSVSFETYMEEMSRSHQRMSRLSRRKAKSGRAKTVNSAQQQSYALGHLEQLIKIMEQIAVIKEQNGKLKKRISFLEDMNRMYKMRSEVLSLTCQCGARRPKPSVKKINIQTKPENSNVSKSKQSEPQTSSNTEENKLLAREEKRAREDGPTRRKLGYIRNAKKRERSKSVGVVLDREAFRELKLGEMGMKGLKERWDKLKGAVQNRRSAFVPDKGESESEHEKQLESRRRVSRPERIRQRESPSGEVSDTKSVDSGCAHLSDDASAHGTAERHRQLLSVNNTSVTVHTDPLRKKKFELNKAASSVQVQQTGRHSESGEKTASTPERRRKLGRVSLPQPEASAEVLETLTMSSATEGDSTAGVDLKEDVRNRKTSPWGKVRSALLQRKESIKRRQRKEGADGGDAPDTPKDGRSRSVFVRRRDLKLRQARSRSMYNPGDRWHSETPSPGKFRKTYSKDDIELDGKKHETSPVILPQETTSAKGNVSKSKCSQQDRDQPKTEELVQESSEKKENGATSNEARDSVKAQPEQDNLSPGMSEEFSRKMQQWEERWQKPEMTDTEDASSTVPPTEQAEDSTPVVVRSADTPPSSLHRTPDNAAKDVTTQQGNAETEEATGDSSTSTSATTTPSSTPHGSIRDYMMNLEDMKKSFGSSYAKKLQDWERKRLTNVSPAASPELGRKQKKERTKEEKERAKLEKERLKFEKEKMKIEKEREKEKQRIEREKEKELQKMERELQKFGREKERTRFERLFRSEKTTKWQFIHPRQQSVTNTSNLPDVSLGLTPRGECSSDTTASSPEISQLRRGSDDSTGKSSPKIHWRRLRDAVLRREYKSKKMSSGLPGLESCQPIPLDLTSVYNIPGSPQVGQRAHSFSDDDQGVDIHERLSRALQHNMELCTELRRKNQQLEGARHDMESLHGRLKIMREEHSTQLEHYRKALDSSSLGGAISGPTLNESCLQSAITDLKIHLEQLELYTERLQTEKGVLEASMLQNEAQYQQATAMLQEEIQSLRQQNLSLASDKIKQGGAVASDILVQLKGAEDLEKVHEFVLELQTKLDQMQLALLHRDKVISQMEWRLVQREAALAILRAERDRQNVELSFLRKAHRAGQIKRCASYGGLEFPLSVENIKPSTSSSCHPSASLEGQDSVFSVDETATSTLDTTYTSSTLDTTYTSSTMDTTYTSSTLDSTYTTSTTTTLTADSTMERHTVIPGEDFEPPPTTITEGNTASSSQDTSLLSEILAAIPTEEKSVVLEQTSTSAGLTTHTSYSDDKDVTKVLLDSKDDSQGAGSATCEIMSATPDSLLSAIKLIEKTQEMLSIDQEEHSALTTEPQTPPVVTVETKFSTFTRTSPSSEKVTATEHSEAGATLQDNLKVRLQTDKGTSSGVGDGHEVLNDEKAVEMFSSPLDTEAGGEGSDHARSSMSSQDSDLATDFSHLSSKHFLGPQGLSHADKQEEDGDSPAMDPSETAPEESEKQLCPDTGVSGGSIEGRETSSDELTSSGEHSVGTVIEQNLHISEDSDNGDATGQSENTTPPPDSTTQTTDSRKESSVDPSTTATDATTEICDQSHDESQNTSPKEKENCFGTPPAGSVKPYNTVVMKPEFPKFNSPTFKVTPVVLHSEPKPVTEQTISPTNEPSPSASVTSPKEQTGKTDGQSVGEDKDPTFEEIIQEFTEYNMAMMDEKKEEVKVKEDKDAVEDSSSESVRQNTEQDMTYQKVASEKLTEVETVSEDVVSRGKEEVKMEVKVTDDSKGSVAPSVPFIRVYVRDNPEVDQVKAPFGPAFVPKADNGKGNGKRKAEKSVARSEVQGELTKKMNTREPKRKVGQSGSNKIRLLQRQLSESAVLSGAQSDSAIDYEWKNRRGTSLKEKKLANQGQVRNLSMAFSSGNLIQEKRKGQTKSSVVRHTEKVSENIRLFQTKNDPSAGSRQRKVEFSPLVEFSPFVRSISESEQCISQQNGEKGDHEKDRSSTFPRREVNVKATNKKLSRVIPEERSSESSIDSIDSSSSNPRRNGLKGTRGLRKGLSASKEHLANIASALSGIAQQTILSSTKRKNSGPNTSPALHAGMEAAKADGNNSVAEADLQRRLNPRARRTVQEVSQTVARQHASRSPQLGRKFDSSTGPKASSIEQARCIAEGKVDVVPLSSKEDDKKLHGNNIVRVSKC